MVRPSENTSDAAASNSGARSTSPSVTLVANGRASGEQYRKVPCTVEVRGVREAPPKSMRRGSPSSVSKMFSGLTSPWKIPMEMQCFKALTTGKKTRRACVSLMGPPDRTSSSKSHAQTSMGRYTLPFPQSGASVRMMDGCGWARSIASCGKREGYPNKVVIRKVDSFRRIWGAIAREH